MYIYIITIITTIIVIVIVSICIYLHSRNQPKIEKWLTSIQINIVE